MLQKKVIILNDNNNNNEAKKRQTEKKRKCEFCENVEKTFFGPCLTLDALPWQ